MKQLFALYRLCILGVLLYIINFHVSSHTVSSIDAILYIIVLFFVKKIFFSTKLPYLQWDRSDWLWVISIFVIHCIFLSILSLIPWHFHFDEFIVAYTSYTLPKLSEINWFGAYPQMWVAQFPLLFYLLQKPFFLFGPTIWAVRISVWPYVFGIVWYTYYLTSSLWSKKIARVSLLVFMGFAPQLYLTSMGLHFISSELFYLAALSHLLLFFVKKDVSHLFPLTVFGVACYLTYTSSYVFLPVLILSTLCIVAITPNRLYFSKQLGKTIIAMILLFSPFLTYHFKDTPFLTQRINQVNIINGTWSTTQEKLANGSTYKSIIWTQIKTSLASLIFPKIGGMGGYEFGHQALLSPIESVFLIIGLGFGIYALWKNHWIPVIVFFFLFIVPFLSGFVLTTHPPPFHRISLLYPWICICIAYALTATVRLVKSFGKVALYITCIACIGTIWVFSFLQINKMVNKDLVYTNWDSVRIASYITKHVQPSAPILIASDNIDFHYFYEFTFRFGAMRQVNITDKKTAFMFYKADRPLLIRYATDEDIMNLTKRYRYLHVIQSYEGLPFEYCTLIIPQSILIENTSEPRVSPY